MAALPNLADLQTSPPVLTAELVEDLQRLQKAAQKITSILDLDPLIDSVVSEVTASFGCTEASIYLHDEERGEMVLAGVEGCDAHDKGYRLKIGHDFIATVVGTAIFKLPAVTIALVKDFLRPVYKRVWGDRNVRASAR